ncbi:MAG: hypothetical protein EBS87_12305, partial [Sphingomonadaceae bacterium]|nr:hypothetical protein [Sphingomonadaceae bacterium]
IFFYISTYMRGYFLFFQKFFLEFFYTYITEGIVPPFYDIYDKYRGGRIRSPQPIPIPPPI